MPKVQLTILVSEPLAGTEQTRERRRLHPREEASWVGRRCRVRGPWAAVPKFPGRDKWAGSGAWAGGPGRPRQTRPAPTPLRRVPTRQDPQPATQAPAARPRPGSFRPSLDHAPRRRPAVTAGGETVTPPKLSGAASHASPWRRWACPGWQQEPRPPEGGGDPAPSPRARLGNRAPPTAP